MDGSGEQAQPQSLAICVLLYGDNLLLHKRCLESVLVDGVHLQNTSLRLGLNAVGEATRNWIATWAGCGPSVFLEEHLETPVQLSYCGMPVSVFTKSNENILKYPMMRAMFHCEALDTPQWFLWLDDDTWFRDPPAAWDLIRGAMDQDCLYFGEEWFWPWRPGQREWIQTRAWYRGLAPNTTVRFATGGFVGIYGATVKQLNWPDPALRHNGGDTLLGEALRQQGINLYPVEPGYGTGPIRVNDGPRRGVSQEPAGTLRWQAQGTPL